MVQRGMWSGVGLIEIDIRIDLGGDEFLMIVKNTLPEPLSWRYVFESGWETLSCCLKFGVDTNTSMRWLK